jgi:hypothetical protein
MKYIVLKGMTVEPYLLQYVAGNVIDNAKDKIDKSIIDQAIKEKRIRPVEDPKREKPAKEKAVKATPPPVVEKPKSNFGNRK